jgi:hypothetical protein
MSSRNWPWGKNERSRMESSVDGEDVHSQRWDVLLQEQTWGKDNKDDELSSRNVKCRVWGSGKDTKWR